MAIKLRLDGTETLLRAKEGETAIVKAALRASQNQLKDLTQDIRVMHVLSQQAVIDKIKCFTLMRDAKAEFDHLS